MSSEYIFIATNLNRNGNLKTNKGLMAMGIRQSDLHAQVLAISQEGRLAPDLHPRAQSSHEHPQCRRKPAPSEVRRHGSVRQQVL